jgi:hypothetical protein
MSKVIPFHVLTAEEFIARKNAEWATQRERRQYRRFKDIGRKGFHCWLRDAWTFRVQPNLREKVHSIERWRLAAFEGEIVHAGSALGDYEYRPGYWIVGKNGNKDGVWTWGQFAPLIPEAIAEIMQGALVEVINAPRFP